MNRVTGTSITTLEHIRQSMADILTTRIGSRVMRREYGSHLVDLIDSPGNGPTLLLCYAAITMSLMRWEPRIRLGRVQLTALSAAGQFTLEVEAYRIDSNAALNLSVPLRMGASL